MGGDSQSPRQVGISINPPFTNEHFADWCQKMVGQPYWYGTSYSRITAVAPGTTLEYVASAFNGWQAVKIGSQVGWVSGEFSEITSE